MTAAAPLRVLLVDDEAPARARLRTLLGDCTAPAARVVGEAADAVQALAWLAQAECDLVLLDIALPARSGLQLATDLQALHGGRPVAAASIPAAGGPPEIVFVTAHADHALQAFDLAAADYLTKPVRRERLQAALLRVAQRRGPSMPVHDRAPDGGTGLVDVAGQGRPDDDGGVVVVQDRGRLLRVPVSAVLYLKAELKYLTLRTATHSHVLDGTLNDFEQRLGPAFLRIHRNALVARRAVRALERLPAAVAAAQGADEAKGWRLALTGVDDQLPVSRRQLSTVRAALMAGC